MSSNPSNCKEYFEMLSAYIDDELVGQELSDLEAHLSVCSGCKKQIQDLKRVQLAVRNLAKEEPARRLQIDYAFLESGSPASTIAGECKPVIELLDAYYDQEGLNQEENQQVEEHLKACQPCKVHLEQIGKMVLDLKSMPLISPPHDIVSNIDFAAIAQAAEAPASESNVIEMKAHARSNVLRTGVFATTAAAAAIALIFAFSMNNQPDPGTRIALDKNPQKLGQNQNQSTNENRSKDEPAAAREVAAGEIAVGETDKEPLNTTVQNSKAKKSKNAETTIKEAKLPKIMIAENKQPTGENRIISTPQAEPENIVELALIPEDAGADALGIGTDEDGLYDIKI